MITDSPLLAAVIKGRITVSHPCRSWLHDHRLSTSGSCYKGEDYLYKKTSGSESRLCYLGHSVMENRHGLIVNAEVSIASGTAERDTALTLLSKLPGKHRKTVGADKLFDTDDFVQRCRQQHITPHVACNDQRRGGSTLDARTTRHVGYEISQRIRKRIEETFGWIKSIGQMRQVKLRGLERVNMAYIFHCLAWNLVRMRNIEAQASQ